MTRLYARTAREAAIMESANVDCRAIPSPPARPPHVPRDVWEAATPEERASGWTEVEVKVQPHTAFPVLEVSCGCNARVTASPELPIRIHVCAKHVHLQTEVSREVVMALFTNIGRMYTHWYATRTRG